MQRQLQQLAVVVFHFYHHADGWNLETAYSLYFSSCFYFGYHVEYAPILVLYSCIEILSGQAALLEMETKSYDEVSGELLCMNRLYLSLMLA